MKLLAVSTFVLGTLAANRHRRDGHGETHSMMNNTMGDTDMGDMYGTANETDSSETSDDHDGYNMGYGDGHDQGHYGMGDMMGMHDGMGEYGMGGRQRDGRNDGGNIIINNNVNGGGCDNAHGKEAIVERVTDAVVGEMTEVFVELIMDMFSEDIDELDVEPEPISTETKQNKNKNKNKNKATEEKDSEDLVSRTRRDTNPAIGFERIFAFIFKETRGVLKAFLENVIRDAATYAEPVKRTARRTVTAMDVVHALKRQGKTLYGFGG